MNTVAAIPVITKDNSFNKFLGLFLNKPILGRVIENCQKIGFVNKIILLTDSKEIENYVDQNYPSIEVEYQYNCRYGTEQLYRYYVKNKDYDWYLTIQSNDPCFPISDLNKMWQKIPKRKDELITFYTQFFCEEDLNSHLSCKTVTTIHDYMIYNSRSIIPIDVNGDTLSINSYKRHINMFAFSNELLEKQGRHLWGNWKSMADITGFEQNRFIEHGIKVKLYRIKHIGFGIDTPEQIKILERRVSSGGEDSGYSSTSLQQLSEDKD